MPTAHATTSVQIFVNNKPVGTVLDVVEESRFETIPVMGPVIDAKGSVTCTHGHKRKFPELVSRQRQEGYDEDGEPWFTTIYHCPVCEAVVEPPTQYVNAIDVDKPPVVTIDTLGRPNLPDDLDGELRVRVVIQTGPTSRERNCIGQILQRPKMVCATSWDLPRFSFAMTVREVDQ